MNKSKYSIGENVLYNKKIATINKVIEQKGKYSYKITINGKIINVPEVYLEEYIEETTPVFEFIENNIGNHYDYKLFNTYIRLKKPIDNTIYSYLSSKIMFNSHQYKPLLRFISSSSEERLFIADEVGVGKTIETGIILKELMSRNRLDIRTPILIICPASLTTKWKSELKNKFDLDFYIHNSKSLKHTLKEGNIPLRYTFSIVGLQTIYNKKSIELLEEIAENRMNSLFSMVIFDEAHRLRNPETNSNKLGHILSDLTDMMLMLSATPLNLSDDDLFNQMNILNPNVVPDRLTFETLQKPVMKLNKINSMLTKLHKDDNVRKDILSEMESFKFIELGHNILSHPNTERFKKRLYDEKKFSIDEIVKYEQFFISLNPLYYSFTRTRKREAFEKVPLREVYELPITLTTLENDIGEEFYDIMVNYHIKKGLDPIAINLVMNIYRRMISSSIIALDEYLDDILNKNIMIDFKNLEEDTEEDSYHNEEITEEFKIKIRDLQSKLNLIKNDSKYDEFKQLLNKLLNDKQFTNNQIIIFSYFIRTLDYLKKKLNQDGYNVGLINGKIDISERDNVINRFRKKEFDILLSSEVGGEGLDFQFCKIIINYDLPYNPMRIEQRIGRIDRFGQKSEKIIVVNAFIKETVDEEIYDRLYRRIRLVEEGIGSIEPILGNELSEAQKKLLSGGLNEQQKEEISERINKTIENTKLQNQELENNKDILLSSDSIHKSLNNMLDNDHFISPQDTIELTNLYLSNKEGCTVEVKEDSCIELKLSEDIVSKVEEYIKNKNNNIVHNELKELLKVNSKIKVIFNGNKSIEYPEHVFISPTGHWSKFIINQLEKEKTMYKAFSFQKKADDIFSHGYYLVFLYEINMHSLKDEISIIGIPIDIDKKEVINCDFDIITRVLSNEVLKDCNINNSIDIEEFVNIADRKVEKIICQKQKQSEESNLYSIKTKITTLNTSSKSRIDRWQTSIDEHKAKAKNNEREISEDFIRMTNAKIDKDKIRTNAIIKELEKYKDITLDYNLEAIVYLEVK